MIDNYRFFTGILAFVLIAGSLNPVFAQITDSGLGQNAGSSQLATEALSSITQQCATIRSWDSNTQNHNDLALGGASLFEYGELKTTLLNNGVGILPGVAGGSLTAAALAQVDVFFWGTTGYILTAPEAAALNNFIQNGGWLILESDSTSSIQASSNSAYNALGLGNRVLGVSGGNVGGTFENVVTATTVGPLGDFRGQSFDGSLARDLDDTGHTLVAQSTVPIRTWVEYTVGSGGVLGLGDNYGITLFAADNNNEAYVNYVLGNHCVDVVGGELLSIDTTALLLAGAQTNAVWIMSALAVIGSVAFGALYITSKKN